MTFERPSLYFVQYSHRRKWEALHRVGDEPADPTDFVDYLDVRTLRLARKEAARLLDEWPFAQPSIRRRTDITAVQWNYSSEPVGDDDD